MPAANPRTPSSRFASRGAFDALMAASDNEEEQQDNGDVESSDDEERVNSNNVTPAADVAPAKLTRTQQKKLAKEAREAKKQQKQAAAAAAAATNTDSAATPLATPAATPAVTSPPPPAPAPAAAPVAAAARPVTPTVPAVSATKPTEPARTPVVEIQKPAAQAPAPKQNGQNGGTSRVTAAAATPAAAPPALKVTPPAPAAASAADRSAYWKKIRERTLFTFVMIFGFIGLLLLGHPYVIILVLVIQVLVYREVTALFEIPGRPSITGGVPRRSPLSRHNSSTKVPKAVAAGGTESDDDDEVSFRAEERKELIWSKTLSWYFFTVANFFLYGESLIYYFKHIVFVDSYFIPFARHHRFLSFLLYVIGFVGFVSGLRRENLKHQFGLFGWVHMSLLLIVFSSHFLVNNILEGLVWLFVPASLVICNDVFAYVCGMIWGKTPLISLSPKKTVEGFVGAFVITEVFAYGWATLFQRYPYMICPATSLGMNAFQDIVCKPNTVFAWHSLPLPAAISAPLSSLLATNVTSIPYTPFQLHSLVMAAFASLVAPFGGFFASGFKRAFNIKDFGDSIPGHGGLTDRFDCQFLMGLFSYVYYSSLIREHHVTVGSVLQTVVTHLSAEEQLETYRELGRFLVSRGQSV